MAEQAGECRGRPILPVSPLRRPGPVLLTLAMLPPAHHGARRGLSSNGPPARRAPRRRPAAQSSPPHQGHFLLATGQVPARPIVSPPNPSSGEEGGSREERASERQKQNKPLRLPAPAPGGRFRLPPLPQAKGWPEPARTDAHKSGPATRAAPERKGKSCWQTRYRTQQ